MTEPVLQRAFRYWRNVDKTLGDRIESGVRAKGARTNNNCLGEIWPLAL